MSETNEMLAIGVDIGGTFTDCTIVGSDETIVSGKRPTTPTDRSIGFFDAIEDAARHLNLTLADALRRCGRLVHGTTAGTNAIVTRTGAKVGLLTTAGHRDVLFIANGTGRTTGVPPDRLMDLVATRDKATPIVPKKLVVEVPERVDSEGEVVVSLSRPRAREVVGELLERGVEAVAVSLLWSFKNPVHEELLVDVVKELAPEIFVTCSSAVLGRLGEYERTAATVFNAYIGPLMTEYIDNIEHRARGLGYAGTVLFSQCAGGAITAEEARRLPLLTVNSGPVAGVMGSVLLAQELQEANVLTTDMGGTTFDVSLIRNYQPLVRDSAILDKYQLAVPMLDVESIGAGGGSIAWIDASGRLDVGPQSAGADPGPACYGHGGDVATVTDADVVLGVISPDSYLHGDFTIDVELAHRAVASLASRLGLDVFETAAGINRIVDAKMADLLRRMSEFRGLDPRHFLMLAFGGAGPVHAASCAREAGVRRVIVPLPDIAPAWSAAGAAQADVVHMVLTSRLLHLPVAMYEIESGFSPIELQLRSALASEGFEPESIRIERALKMRYELQVYDIDVPVDAELMSDDVEALVERFSTLYAERYGANSSFKESGIAVTALQGRGIGLTDKVSFLRRSMDDTDRVVETRRNVYWAELKGFADTPVLRSSGRWNHERTVQGPCLIEFPDTVVVIRPDQSARLDAAGFVVIAT